jgi:hypothetical protein
MKFNNLVHNEKLEIQKHVLQCMDLLDGRNYFLGMLEDIRNAKQHPLLNKTGKFHFKNGIISWNKEIYKDKVTTIKTMLIKYSGDNLFDIKDVKLLKDVKHVINTLAKIVYTIELKDGKTYSFHSFKVISQDNIELDMMFQIIFFDSINNTKRILDYKL